MSFQLLSPSIKGITKPLAWEGRIGRKHGQEGQRWRPQATDEQDKKQTSQEDNCIEHSLVIGNKGYLNIWEVGTGFGICH